MESDILLLPVRLLFIYYQFVSLWSFYDSLKWPLISSIIHVTIDEPIEGWQVNLSSSSSLHKTTAPFISHFSSNDSALYFLRGHQGFRGSCRRSWMLNVALQWSTASVLMAGRSEEFSRLHVVPSSLFINYDLTSVWCFGNSSHVKRCHGTKMIQLKEQWRKQCH